MGAALYDVLPFENLYWSQSETLPAAEMQALQLRRLQQTVERARNVPLYAGFFAERSVAIETLDDVHQLPLTTLHKVQTCPLADRLGVPRYKLARVYGGDLPMACTYADLNAGAERSARFLYANGVRGNHLLTDLSSGELWRGAERLLAGWQKADEATVTEAVQTMRSEELVLDVAQLKRLTGTEQLLTRCGLPLRSVFVETDDLTRWSTVVPAMMPNVTRWFSTAPIFRSFALQGLLGPCVAFECHEHSGFHVHEDDFLVECLDPDTQEPVPDGTTGELVITSLNLEATPLLRLRTGKLVILDRTPCACGRERMRLLTK